MTLVLLSTGGTMIGAEGIAGADEVNRPADSAGVAVVESAATVNILLGLAATGAIVLFFAAGWYRLKRIPNRPILFTPLTGFGLLVAMFLMLPIGAGLARAVFGIAPPAEDVTGLAIRDQVLLTLGAYTGQTLVLLVYLKLLAGARTPTPDGRLRPVVAIVFGVAALVLCWPIVQMTGALTGLLHTLVTGENVELIAHSTLALLRDSAADHWRTLLIAMLVLATPALEELTYRGLLQESLRRAGMGAWSAILLTSLIFGFMHFGAVPLRAVLPLLVLSIGFGWAYEKSGRLLAPIAMHAGFNAANLVLALWTVAPAEG